jgi:hypothetical protein
MPFDPDSVRDLLDALVTAYAVLGGAIAYQCGLAATMSRAAGASLADTAEAINKAMAHGFVVGVLAALFAAMIVVWT